MAISWASIWAPRPAEWVEGALRHRRDDRDAKPDDRGGEHHPVDRHSAVFRLQKQCKVHTHHIAPLASGHSRPGRFDCPQGAGKLWFNFGDMASLTTVNGLLTERPPNEKRPAPGARPFKSVVVAISRSRFSLWFGPGSPRSCPRVRSCRRRPTPSRRCRGRRSRRWRTTQSTVTAAVFVLEEVEDFQS